MKILETKRLSLEVTTQEDIPVLQEKVFADEEVVRLTFGGRSMTLEETSALITSRFNRTGKQTGLASLKEKRTGRVVGFAGILPCRPLGEKDLELGFVLAKSAWGKGYATEIGQAQIEFGFQQMRARRILAMAHPANLQSIKVLSKLGMKYKTDIVENERGPRKVYCIENPAT